MRVRAATRVDYLVSWTSAIRRRRRSALALSPAFSASASCTPSHASSGRRHPCADAVSTASAIAAGFARPSWNSTPVATSRASGSSTARERGRRRVAAEAAHGERTMVFRQQGDVPGLHAVGQVVGVGAFRRRRVGPQLLESFARPDIEACHPHRAARELGHRDQVDATGAREFTARQVELRVRHARVPAQVGGDRAIQCRLGVGLPLRCRRSAAARGQQHDQRSDGAAHDALEAAHCPRAARSG